MKKLIILLIVGITYFPVQINAQISETRYDYTALAEYIAEGCNNKLEQARNIYLWICQNIAYDTDYKVYTADDCYDLKRGVCQAYCELFYRLGEPLGLKTTIISGRTKNQHGQVERTKHAWLYVEVDEGSILIDPTWGAGSIKNGVFVRNENDLSWFQIDPYWLIFTHYPDDKNFQFTEPYIDWKTFTSLPTLYPSSTQYGWDGKKVLTEILSGKTQSLPKIYDQYSEYLSLVNIPMQNKLQPGNFYTFTVQKKKENAIVLIHDGEFIQESEWEKEGDNYTLQYMPVSAGTVALSIAKADKKYNAVVVYQVPAPTQAELKNIEKHSPQRMPEIKKLKNFDLKQWETIGVNGQELLKSVRLEKITSLPILYKHAGTYLREVQIPFSEILKAGQTYTFSFIPQGGIDWQIINGEDWYGDWQIDEKTGRHTMQITPKPAIKFRLSVQLKEGGPYESMVGYQVK